MSASGLNITPVQSDVGSKLSQVSTGTGSNNFSAVGYMKCSHDGTKLANALFGFLNRTELFDFDNSTGKLSNTRSIAGPHFSQGFLFAFGGAYGLEFSANDSLLYVSTVYEDPFLLQASGWIYQYQISSGNQTTINSSASLIIQASGIAWGAMQLAPDCRIYISDGAITGSAASLDVIQNPDVPGSGCGYQHNAFNLNGKTSGFGLPQFLSPCRKVNFSFLSACPGDTVKFTDKSTPPLTACSWNFGDPLSGIFNSSSLKNPTHIYANPGTYLVKLVVSGHGYKDSVEKQVTISKPQVELGNDTTLCPGSSITLNAGNPGASYEWWYKASPTSSATVLSSGTAAQTITKNSPGLYWAKVTINNCMQSDTILIDNFPALLDSLGNDTTLCAGQSLVIHAGNKPGASYVWSTGSMGEFIVADSSATYSVSISKNGCTSLFDKHIDFVNPVSIDIGKDSTLCSGQTITLSTNLSHASFLWSTGSVSNSITVGDSGTYWVEAHYYTCPKVSDTIVLYYIPGIEYVIPNLISPNGDGLNDEFRILNLIPNTTVHIDNRWGSEVYKSKNYRNDWNGDKLSAGVYYYFIGNDNSCVRDYKGWLYIEK
ncbi:MAG: gliding motility-associated C-terminal domain-containing protein, partial [Cytophagaceae bacterium]